MRRRWQGKQRRRVLRRVLLRVLLRVLRRVLLRLLLRAGHDGGVVAVGLLPLQLEL